VSLTLHLGVAEFPYSHNPARGGARRAPKGTTTTYDVARILEAKYGVMQAFYNAKSIRVSNYLEEGLKNSLEALLTGAPPTSQPFAGGTAKIEDSFKQFLSTREIERMGIPGVPTQAALGGVSHRFKRARAARPRRPSFIDTGLYQASFKAWVD
jgi:hypothetical protein